MFQKGYDMICKEFFLRKNNKKSLHPVYIPIESSKREMEAKLMVAGELLKSGHVVLIGREDLVNSYAKIGPRGSFWFKNPAQAKYSLAKELKERHTLFLLDEESGIIHDDQKIFIRDRCHPETMSLFDTIGAWSSSQHAAISEAFSLGGNVKCTGSPRLDLMVNQKKRRSGFERKILFSSNFSAVSALPEKTKRKFIKSGSSGMRDISSASKENLEYQKILAGKFKAILYEIATKFSCSQLIIRPHPGEGGANFWDEIVRNKKNVGFDKNLTLSRSISEATVILHSGCTAAIDGAIQGVPSIYYFPLELDPRLIEQGDVSTKVSYQCYTECEVINALAKLLRMPVLLPRAARITERFSNVMDGKCYLRVAKELTHNSSDGFKVRSFPAFYFILKNFFSLRHWKDFLRAYFPRLTPGGRWASQRMPETSIASLDQIIGEQLKFKASKIKVESICPGLFLLSNKEAS